MEILNEDGRRNRWKMMLVSVEERVSQMIFFGEGKVCREMEIYPNVSFNRERQMCCVEMGHIIQMCCVEMRVSSFCLDIIQPLIVQHYERSREVHRLQKNGRPLWSLFVYIHIHIYIYI
ncbi:hypothetical protein Dimus_004897, partial [Dionaea muscipula]